MQGYKSYSFAALLGISAIAFGLGWIDQDTFLVLAGIFGGGGIVGLRAAVEKK